MKLSKGKKTAGSAPSSLAAALRRAPLCGVEDAEAALAALRPIGREYARGEILLRAGQACARFGLIEAGTADVVREDAGGSPVTVARLTAGDLFAEAFAFGGLPASVSVAAAEHTRVLWLEAERIISGDPRVAANALRVFARKNVFLTERIEHLSRRSLSDKVLSYLSAERRRAGKDRFRIPFDRAGLADYLGCDRSALSAVLSPPQTRGRARLSQKRLLFSGTRRRVKIFYLIFKEEGGFEKKYIVTVECYRGKMSIFK